jgi:hypothetical protein
MRNPLTWTRAIIGFALAALASALTFSPVAMAQTAQAQGGNGGNVLYNKLNNGPGGPAPAHDLSGFWTGPIQAQPGDAPSMTPLGKQIFSANKPERQFNVKSTNDNFVKTCDPMGFPYNAVYEIRGLGFAAMPDRVMLFYQMQRVWREVWTDGRALPKNVGGAEKGATDPRYYGYSVGHWEGDNTFVIETTGLDDKTWLDPRGYPHSVDAHVEERYTRPDHNDLQSTVTVDDPKMYTKPFVLGTSKYRWIPDQELDEQLCVPSDILEYMKLVGDLSN